MHPLAQSLALTLALAGVAAHAASSQSSAAVGGAIGTKDFIPVLCAGGGGVPAAVCAQSMLDGVTTSSAAVAASHDSAGSSFTGSAAASASASTELHARVELTASGAPMRLEEIWFGNARVSSVADLVVDPASPADLGLPVDLTLIYRFDGSLVQTGTDVLSVTANVLALGYDSPFSNGSPCLPDGAGLCTMPTIRTTYGTAFTFQSLLQTTAEIRVIPGSAVGYSAHALADYSHTLGLVGATLRNTKGELLTGWSLTDLADDEVLVTSPVPEPGAWALLLAGLATLGLRRRGRRAVFHFRA